LDACIHFSELPMVAKTLTQADLAQFTGSEQWHRHGFIRDVTYTDGAKYVADQYGAHWLLDEIAIIQMHNVRVAREAFQVWKLSVRQDQSAALNCEDWNNHLVYTKQIAYTDFPTEGISLWFTNNTILLPSEY
jgi:hypothetical protein